MDISAITSAIGTLGFPIAMCLLLFWQNLKENEQHDKELNDLKQVLENNTIALTKLCDKIEVEAYWTQETYRKSKEED